LLGVDGSAGIGGNLAVEVAVGAGSLFDELVGEGKLGGKSFFVRVGVGVSVGYMVKVELGVGVIVLFPVIGKACLATFGVADGITV